MSDYSGYQIKRTYAQGPFATVHEATAPSGGPGRFALKIFHPPASTHIRRAYAIEGWLLAAERQQKAAKKDGAVLEVVAFGRCPEGAYMVTPWQERSLEPLVANLAAKGDVLRAVAELLLGTLEQWGGQTGGSHRKLKPSNVFLTRSGPLSGTTAVLSDAWFLLGVKSETPRRNDLAAVGAILAQIVRRREVAAWPIEDAPEWKALGRPGKAWLAYVNYLMDPQPASGELTIAEARKRLRAIPKDSNPARTALLIGIAAAVLAVAGVGAFARFGNPIYMPDNIRRLAETVGNPRAVSKEVPESWARLCRAWDTWLADLRGNAPRLLRTEALWSGPNDPLRLALADFSANADSLLPGTVVPEAAAERRLGVLADSPPEAVLNELRKGTVQEDVTAAYQRVLTLASRLENWPRWDEMRDLQGRLEARGFNRAVGALQPKLPIQPGTAGYKFDMARTLKLFSDVSLDETGMLLLASRWSEVTRFTTDMEATTGDRVQQAMPRLILARLVDRGSLGAFADSLEEPLTELKARRQRYLDPQVVRERFLKESPLNTETAEVTLADFPRWEQELAEFSKVLAGDDPRQVVTLNDSVNRLRPQENDLEEDAPTPDPDGLPTLSRADFRTEFQQRQTELTTLRAEEIVRRDLPQIIVKTEEMTGRLQLLEQRVAYTLTLLNPATWLEKVRQAKGNFNETRARWTAWQQAAVGSGVTAESLAGPANRPRFRALRAQERQVREWIDGLEGREGLGALVVPDLTAYSSEIAEPLRQLEAARREQAAADVGRLTTWQAALPTVTWAATSATAREPITAHREWLAALPAFATDLDRLGALLAGGFSWTEGVSEVVDRLTPRPGLDALTGAPAAWNTEARLLGRLVASADRTELAAAAQNGGLSRKLTAWRRLGTLTGWPANAVDLDIDGAVVADLRTRVGETVREAARRGSLLEELSRETRVRWNRAARNSAANIEQMTAVFERMAKYGIAETDLEDPALYNLKLWQLKRSDWSEVDLAPLKARRDAFVSAVRSVSGAVGQPAVKKFVDELDAISLVVDPNRKPTSSPRLAGWTEELTNAGLGLTATWQKGGKTVKLDFSIVQPADDTPPFYLAKRVLAVGEFIDLMATSSKEDVATVRERMPVWAVRDAIKPPDMPVSWRPVVSNTGQYEGFELNPTWFLYPSPPMKGLMDDLLPNPATKSSPIDRAADNKVRAFTQAMSKAEAPSLRSPMQQISFEAAKNFAEKMLGARLPTTREWQAVLQAVGKPPSTNLRGQNFQELFEYFRDYNVAGQTIRWRPNEGAFRPGKRGTFVDDGRSSEDRDESRFWFTSVDDGPATAGFINLTGNISIYLQDGFTSYVAGGSVLSPPSVDFTQPQKTEGASMVGGKSGTEAYSDVGIRPAFDAPPGFKERYKFLVLVRQQGFLTW